MVETQLRNVCFLVVRFARGSGQFFCFLITLVVVLCRTRYVGVSFADLDLFAIKLIAFVLQLTAVYNHFL